MCNKPEPAFDRLSQRQQTLLVLRFNRLPRRWLPLRKLKSQPATQLRVSRCIPDQTHSLKPRQHLLRAKRSPTLPNPQSLALPVQQRRLHRLFQQHRLCQLQLKEVEHAARLEAVSHLAPSFLLLRSFRKAANYW